MIALFIAVVAMIALVALIAIEIARARTKPAVTLTQRSAPRRQPHLEDRIRAAFDAPRGQYGDVFVKYAVWKRDQETRLELYAAGPFAQLNEFTRCLIVRHLWRALEGLAEGSVVVVDSPPQRWSKAIDQKFHDHGIDPWRLVSNVNRVAMTAPQFAKD
jgi:hypothetical protein